MADSMYHPTTPKVAERRKDLAPGVHDPASHMTPNSSVNQKTSAIIATAASVSTRSIAAPAARLSAAKRASRACSRDR